MRSESCSLTDGLDRRIFRWKWNAAAVHLPCIDAIVAPATNTCPIVPRGLRRDMVELENTVVSQGGGIAHRGVGVTGAAVIPRLSVNGRSGCAVVVLDWP